MRSETGASRAAIYFLEIVFLAGLAGCVAQNPPRADPSAAPLTLGEFTIKAAQSNTSSHKPEKIAETSTFDESASFRHWQVYFFSNCDTCDSATKDMLRFLRKYQDYCASRSGQWEVSGGGIPRGTCSGPSPFEIKMNFHVEHDALVIGTKPNHLLVDAFERKEGTRRELPAEYSYEAVTRINNFYNAFGTNSAMPVPFRGYVKRDFATERANAEAESLRRARAEDTMQREQEAKKLFAAATYLAKTKTVGQQVCRIYGAKQNLQTRSGYTTAVIEQPYRVAGFTEGVAGDKIQIRISGITTFDAVNGGQKAVPKIDGTPTLAPGLIIYDDPVEWRPC